MQMNESEAAAALLLIVEQSYRDLHRSVPEMMDEAEPYHKKHAYFVDGSAPERGASLIYSAHRYDLTQEKAKRKPGSRQKLSKTAQGECERAETWIRVFLPASS
jgi:hypothetical protein